MNPIRIRPHAPDTLEPANTWHNQAACLGHDPEIFFTEAAIGTARRICARCPGHLLAHRKAPQQPPE